MQFLRHDLKVRRFLEGTSIAELIVCLKQQDVALAILILGIPGLGGTCAAYVRALLFVALSAHERREDILEALFAGVRRDFT